MMEEHRCRVSIYGKINPQLAKYTIAPAEGLTSADAYVLNSKNGLERKFLYTTIQTERFYKYSVSVSARTGMPKINRDELNLFRFKGPGYDEQSKIGTYFQHLDAQITQHRRKLSKLGAVKKAMLTKMFPQEGSAVPEIRFKGFTGEWERKTLGEIGQVVTGSTPPTADKSNYDGNYLFVSPADIQCNRYVESTITNLSKTGFEKGRIIKAHSILFVSIGSTIGKVAQNKVQVTTNQQINAIVPISNYDCDFVFSLMVRMSQEIRLLSATQAVPIINKSSFCNITVCVTMDIEEQTKIGRFFQNLDSLISLQQRELDKLKNIKKACLEKMFV